MIVNGVDLRQYLKVNRINRPPTPRITNVTLEVPGMSGYHHIRNEKKERLIFVDYSIIGETVQDRIEKAHIIAGYLVSDKEMTIVFPDEPDKVYIGSLTGDTNIREIARLGQGTLTFFCSDPHILDTGEQTAQFNSEGQLTILNDGTAETYPSFSIAFNQPTTHFEIINHTTNKAVRLGFPVSVEQTPIDPQELKLHDTMASTSGWQSGVQIDGGTISGQFESDGQRFYVEDFGEGSAWHGPALRRSLSEQLQDFRVEARIKLNNLVGQVGRVEIYLLDINDQIIGKIAIRDSHPSNQINYGEAQARAGAKSEWFINEPGDRPGNWNDFDGLLRLERLGSRWYAYIAKIRPDGTHYARRSVYWRDYDGLYTPKLASVQVHIGAHSTWQPCEMSISEIKVFKMNEPQSEQEVPYIAHAGDVITVNNGLNRVLRNGEPFSQVVAIENAFFSLKKGTNDLEVFPKDVADVTMTWRRRWV